MFRRLYPPAVCALVTLLACWKVIFHSEFTLLAGSDMARAYYPYFDVAAYWLKRGVFLLWDPYVYAGKPAMGEPQPGLYYPLNWLVMLLPSRDGGQLRSIADHSIVVPTERTDRAQEIHLCIEHAICEIIETELTT